MNLDKLTVNVKPLAAYQAMDLGLAVARAWYGELWWLWWRYNAKLLLVVLIVSGILYYWITQNEWKVFWCLCLIWWCKPFFEKPLVIYLSQKLFDADYHIEHVTHSAKAMPSLSFMLLRRPAFKRVMLMPIYLLEGQLGKNVRTRLQVLTRKQDNAIVLHSMVFFVAEMILWAVGLDVLRWLLGMDTSTNVWQQGSFLAIITGVISVVGYLLAVSVIAPFFVASGFMMYLCKRSLLEGWGN